MPKFLIFLSAALGALAVVGTFTVVGAVQQAADWRSEAVAELADAGVPVSFPDGSFLGSDPLTGYQAAVLLNGLLETVYARTGCGQELIASNTPTTFSDVSRGPLGARRAGGAACLAGYRGGLPQRRIPGERVPDGLPDRLFWWAGCSRCSRRRRTAARPRSR